MKPSPFHDFKLGCEDAELINELIEIINNDPESAAHEIIGLWQLLERNEIDLN